MTRSNIDTLKAWISSRPGTKKPIESTHEAPFMNSKARRTALWKSKKSQ
jgi:hypothetical protein